MNEIWQLRNDIDRREREERKKLLEEHNKKFKEERQDLMNRCGEIGHVEGKFWYNGLGYSWYYCANCGGVMKETVMSRGSNNE